MKTTLLLALFVVMGTLSAAELDFDRLNKAGDLFIEKNVTATELAAWTEKWKARVTPRESGDSEETTVKDALTECCKAYREELKNPETAPRHILAHLCLVFRYMQQRNFTLPGRVKEALEAPGAVERLVAALTTDNEVKAAVKD